MSSDDERGNDLPQGVRIRMPRKVVEGDAETKRKLDGRFRKKDRKNPESGEKRRKEEASLHYPPLKNRDRTIKVRCLGFGLSGYAKWKAATKSGALTRLAAGSQESSETL